MQRAEDMKLEGIVDMTRCLLIEEDAGERKRLSKLLGSLGLETAETAGTADAIRYCSDRRPDVVVMAADGRGMAPRDFVKQVRRPGKGNAPVIILYSADPDTQTIGETILEGAADFIMKPFDRELLQFKLRQAGIL